MAIKVNISITTSRYMKMCQIHLHTREESRQQNSSLSVKFYICEVLNAANAVAQFYFTAWFLNGNFSKIATEGLYLEENESVLPILSECKISM